MLCLYQPMAKVTGIGGVFFRSPNPEATKAWYAEQLGIEMATDFPGAVVHWKGGETTIWSLFEADTEYFGPSGQPSMVNYRVDDLAAMLAKLRASGVEVDDAEEHSEFGDFGWAVDCDGNRFELWQPPPGS